MRRIHAGGPGLEAVAPDKLGFTYTGFVTAFNTYGYASQVSSTGSDGGGKALWTALALDAERRITKTKIGNGLNSQRTYNAYMGRLERITTGPDDGSGGAVAAQQADVYQYDSIGNLSSRTQLVATSGSSMIETFDYNDALNRLKSSTVFGQATKSYDYDDLGNLKLKAGAAYAYPLTGAGSVRPHAVSGIAGTLAGVTNPSFSGTRSPAPSSSPLERSPRELHRHRLR